MSFLLGMTFEFVLLALFFRWENRTWLVRTLQAISRFFDWLS